MYSSYSHGPCAIKAVLVMGNIVIILVDAIDMKPLRSSTLLCPAHEKGKKTILPPRRSSSIAPCSTRTHLPSFYSRQVRVLVVPAPRSLER
jgi:hypothetical protein